ncbi:MAG: ATP-binding protein [Chloroflexota bacterium]
MPAQIFNGAYYHASLLALPPFLTAVTMLTLGGIVLWRESDARVRLSFFVMTATAATWLFGYSLMYCAGSKALAAAWSVAGHVGIIFIPAAVFHFTTAVLQIYNRFYRRVWLVWALCAAFLLALLYSNWFLSDITAFSWGYYPRYNWLGVCFIGFFFVLMALSLREYWRAYRYAGPGLRRFRNRNLLGAFCVAYLGSLDYLPALGVPLYPFGYIALLGFVGLVGRTIHRYRLVDITPEFAAKEIIHAMGEAVLVLDSEGVVRVANPAAAQIFAQTEQRLDGESIVDLVRAFSAPAEQLARQLTEGRLRDYECATNGGALTVSLSSFLMRDKDENTIATVCMIRDITQSKAAARQIAAHTERQAALYELNVAATSTLELSAVLNVLLQRLESLVPRTATTVMLRSALDQPLRRVACRGIDELAWQCEPDAATEISHPVLVAKDVIWLGDIRQPQKGLDVNYFIRQGFRSYLGLPLIAKDQVIGIVSFYSRDVRRFNDEEINFLRSLAGQAAVAIHNSALYEETRRQAAALKKANQVKEDFLSVMSHELRTPLNVICGYTKLVQEGMVGTVNAEQRKALDTVSRHADELLFMVNSIMNAAQIEAGGLTVDCQEFLLKDLLNELKELYDYPRAKAVRLEWDYPDDLPALHNDRGKLKHVLQNLINNALKFTDAGCVKITAKQTAAQSDVEITVSDTGIGIPREDLPLIFERFRQVDSSRTRAHGGVGLGLHIVKTFTQLLKGGIEVASIPGQGTTFTLTFPRTGPSRH